MVLTFAQAQKRVEQLANDARMDKALGTGKLPADIQRVREIRLRPALHAINVASYR